MKRGINFKMSNTLFRVSFAVLCSRIGTQLSLWQKIILNRVFAVARGIIYEHKFSVYTIFLTRLEHSYFNTCKILLKFYDDFNHFSNNGRTLT